MLTQKQRDLLILIHNRMSAGQIAPSFDEMRDQLGLKSKSGIHRLITGLVERGYLQRLPHRARALEVVKLPDGYMPGAKDTTGPARTARAIQSVRDAAAGLVSIPLFGKIAAGTPIEAIRDDGHTIDLPASMVSRGDYYALTVQGDSMIDAGIHSGDTAIIRRGDTAENGTIVVALIDQLEVTLKRLRRKDGMVILQAENPAYDDRALPPDRVQIQGQLTSLVRVYR
jgi:repressor LexA